MLKCGYICGERNIFVMKNVVLRVSLLLICTTLTAKEYNVAEYGAVPGGSVLCTSAIQAAIDDCASSGGGRVVLPSGVFLSGTLNLKSGVEFYLSAGAELRATLDLSCYKRYNEQPAGLFYTEGASGVAITGPGVVNGQGMEFMYADMPKKIGLQERLGTRQGESFRKVESGIGDGPLEPKDRFHQMIVFSCCTDVRLEDFTCVDSPFWCFLVVHCQGVKVRGLTIDNNLLIPNSDGIDVISSSEVNISDCFFRCGDDCIVLAGYGWHQGDPGFKNLHTPARNINVSNCILQSRSSGIRIGGHDQNPMSDFQFSNITIYDSNRGINISVSDAESLENVTFNNIHIETRLHTGDWWGQGEPIHITAMQLLQDKPVLGKIRNLFFNNVTCVGENSILMIADPQTKIENVFFNNFEFVLRKSAIEDIAGGNYDLRLTSHADRQLYPADEPVVYLENVSGAVFSNGSIRWDGADKSYHTYPIDALDSDNLTVCSVRMEAPLSYPSHKGVHTRNCKKVRVSK